MDDLISRTQAIQVMMDEDVDHVQGISGREVIQILMDLRAAQPQVKCVAKITLNKEQVQDAVEKAKREILAELPRWIPVTERLPEKNGRYLVTTSKGQVQRHVFSHDGNSEEYWTRCNTAWMPLPEPYKGGEQDDR